MSASASTRGEEIAKAEKPKSEPCQRQFRQRQPAADKTAPNSARPGTVCPMLAAEQRAAHNGAMTRENRQRQANQ